MKVTTLHPATVANSEDRLLANRYSGLEGEVTNLTRMARLAEILLNEAVGQLECKDGKYIEAPDYEATDLAVFAVQQMADMAKRFEGLYYQGFARSCEARL